MASWEATMNLYAKEICSMRGDTVPTEEDETQFVHRLFRGDSALLKCAFEHVVSKHAGSTAAMVEYLEDGELDKSLLREDPSKIVYFAHSRSNLFVVFNSVIDSGARISDDLAALLRTRALEWEYQTTGAFYTLIGEVFGSFVAREFNKRPRKHSSPLCLLSYQGAGFAKKFLKMIAKYADIGGNPVMAKEMLKYLN
jgi:hypothetical protein